MDWITFFSKLIDSLLNLIAEISWPAIVFFIIYFGKDKILILLTSLRSIKYDKFQADFEVGSTEAADKAEELLPHPDKNQKRYQMLQAQLMQVDPLTAIITAWNYIDQEIKHALERAHIEFKRRSYTPTFHMKILLENNLITEEQFNLFISMRDLRNKAVHNALWEISPIALENYIASALNLMSFLDSIHNDVEDMPSY